MDTYQVVLRSQTGTTSLERGRAMPTTDAKEGWLLRLNAQSTPFLTSVDAGVRQTWLVTVFDEEQFLF